MHSSKEGMQQEICSLVCNYSPPLFNLPHLSLLIFVCYKVESSECKLNFLPPLPYLNILVPRQFKYISLSQSIFVCTSFLVPLLSILSVSESYLHLFSRNLIARGIPQDQGPHPFCPPALSVSLQLILSMNITDTCLYRLKPSGQIIIQLLTNGFLEKRGL